MFSSNGYYKLPLDPSLVAWFDANQILGINTALPSNGAQVSKWYDLSGHGNHAVQATSARQPIFTTNVLNGLPGVLGVNASNQFMTVSSAAGGILEITPSITYFCVFSLTDIGVTTHAPFYKDSGNGLSNGPYGIVVSTNTINTVYVTSADVTIGISAPVTAATSTPYIFQSHFSSLDSTRPSTTYNTSGVLTGSTQGANLGTSNASLNLLCQKNNGLRSLSGYLIELLIYNRYLPAAQQLSVKQYLGNKYNISVT